MKIKKTSEYDFYYDLLFVIFKIYWKEMIFKPDLIFKTIFMLFY